MNKPRIFGLSLATVLAIAVAAGGFLAYWEMHAKGDQSQDDRLNALEVGDAKIQERQDSTDVRVRNAEALQTWTVIVLSMIADRQGIKNLPPLPLLSPAPRVGERLDMEREAGPESALVPSAMADERPSP